MILVNKFKINLLLTLLLISTLLGNALFNIFSIIFTIILLYEIFKNDDLHFFNQKWLRFVFVFYLILLMSTILSEYRSEIFFKNLTFFRFFLLALSVQYCLQKYQNMRLFLYIITGITFFISFDSFVQYFFGTNLFGNNLVQENIARIRLTSIFGDEEIVGSYLIKFLSLGTIGCFLLFRNNKIITYFYFILISFIILISQERMAFLLLLLSISLILIFYLWKKKLYEVFAITIVLFISLILIFNFDKSLKARYLSIFTNSSGFAEVKYDESNKPINTIESVSEIKKVKLSFRDSIWGAHYITAFEIFKNNILIGSGPRSFRYECNKTEYENLDIHYVNKRCSTHPHNFFLEILSETGFIGFCYFIFLLIFFYINQLKFFIYKRNIVHLFGLMAIFVNLWPIASSGSIYASFNGLIIWITIGFILSFSKENPKSL